MTDFSQLYKRLKNFPEQSLTTFEKGRYIVRPYPDLCDEVEVIMARLVRAGVRSGMRVGILSENRYEWLLYDWALAALDCVSVAFPEDYAASGLQTLIETYELVLIVSNKTLLKQAELPEKGLLLFDEAPREGETIVAPQPDGLMKREDELSNCFSTGTAGSSKGLLISGRGTARIITDCMGLYGLGQGDSILVFMPLTAFQQRFFTYAGPLMGLSIHLIKPLHLFRAMKDLSPNIIIGPPSLFEAIYEQAMPKRALPALLVNLLNRGLRRLPRALGDPIRRRVYAKLLACFGDRVKVMLCGMAKTSPATIRFFRDVGLPLYEVYGLIETGLVAANTGDALKIGTVGKAFPGCRIKIAADGEVLVRKEEMVARAYIQTIGSLREPHYFEEWFPTGDMGDLDEDGFLTLRGRKDNTIVTDSGHKIQPEVLEARLEAFGGVKRAVVFGGGGLTCLTAVIVTDGEAELRPKIKAAIDKLNRSVEQWCEIGAVVYADSPFSMENGLLNRGLKVNRNKVFETYRTQILATESD